MDARYRIEMLGELRVVQGEQTYTRFRTHKAASLLTYLALHGQQAHPRERLLDLLWADMELNVARLNLNTTLTQLRRQLEPVGVPAGSLLITDKLHVRLNPASVSTDVADFDRLLRQARQKEEDKNQEDKSQEEKNTEEKNTQFQEAAAFLEQAIALYRGPLLPGWYEEWVTAEQTRFQSEYLDALRRLTKLWEEAGKYSEALTLAQRLTDVDPYAESGWLAQMRLLVRLRKPSAALQAYERLEALFRQELGAHPSAGSQQMAEMIRRDPRAVLLKAETAAGSRPSVMSASAVPPSAGVSPKDSPIVQAPAPAAAPAAPPLPLQLTRFFGREAEQEQIAALLQTPGTRLVSLLGPGGAGKTRLAVEVAARVAPAFANRVWFVPLADIPNATLIPSALLHALRLPPAAQGDPLEQIAVFLGEAPCLLVLDNLEHLLRDKSPVGKNDNLALSGSAGLIRLLLLRTPGLVCLATSRTALRLSGEQEFPLPPLALPSPESAVSSLEPLMRNESVALYMDRARTVRPDFALTTANAVAVATLCRRLEGMPLAIEMAAAWVKTIPPHKMLERLTQQLDMLVSRRRDLPPRHQSLRAAIEWSYDLLSPDLQAFFARLSVFRGGWTLEAAEAVCGSDALYALRELQEHSLIVEMQEVQSAQESKDTQESKAPSGREWESEPRYRMLEPLREFAHEKLMAKGEDTATRNRHRDYLICWMEQEGYALGSVANTERLQPEHDNLRSALDWCQETSEGAEAGLQLVSMAHNFWHECGYWQEGLQRMKAALAHSHAPPTAAWHRTRLKANFFRRWLGDWTGTEALLNECLDYFRAAGDKEGIAECLLGKSDLAVKNGDIAEAQHALEENVALWRDLNDTINLPVSLFLLGTVTLSQGNRVRALAAFEEAHRLDLEKGQSQGLAQCFIGHIHTLNGDFPRAAHTLRAALQAYVVGRKHFVVDALGYLAVLAQTQGQKERAACLFGAFQECSEVMIGKSFQWPRGGTFDTSLTRLQAEMEATEFSAALTAGRAMSLEQITDYALQDVPIP